MNNSIAIGCLPTPSPTPSVTFLCHLYLCRFRVYNAIHRTFTVTSVIFIVYVLSEMFYLWNANMKRTWNHYVRKERERTELMQLIRIATENGDLDLEGDGDKAGEKESEARPAGQYAGGGGGGPEKNKPVKMV